MLKNLPVTFLMTFGHCGLDWMHSLLDSHKQILITPALSFYRCWKILDADTATNVNEMFNIWNKYITKYIGPDSHNEQKKFLHTDQEMELFFSEFRKHLESDGINKISVFWAIHESYALAKGIQIDSIKSIVVHEHLPWPFQEIFLDFDNANFLIMMRDPRAAIAGLFKGRVSDFGYLPDFAFNIILESWLQGVEIYNKYHQVLGSRLKIVKNEDLHDSLEINMRDIAKWLQIDFSKSMWASTNASGIISIPDSRYLDDIKKINYSEFYSPKNIRKRWLSVCNDKEILMIETILRDIMTQFEYDRMTRDTVISRVKGYVFFMFPHRSTLSEWLKDYPNIVDFPKIEDRLKNKINKKAWRMLPTMIKFSTLVLFVILRRASIYHFPGDRWRRYDHKITDKLGLYD